jgi:alkylhydroperoxidase family enzyme
MASVVDELFAAAWESTDPRLLELCRLRLAELIGHEQARGERTPEAVAAGLDEGQVAQLSAWPTSHAFDARERACLALAEQFAIDVKGIDQALVDDVRAQLSVPEAFAFIAALWPVEQQLRWSLTVERLFDRGTTPSDHPNLEEGHS